MDVISFINMKGGVGKTTLSINVADCLSSRHEKRVLVVDIDPQFNATQCLISPDDYIQHLKDKKDTIINIFSRTHRTVSAITGIEDIVPKKLEDIKPVKIKENFYLLPGSLELFRIEMTPGEGTENRLKKFLKKCKDDFDIVIIDTPPTPSIWMTSALLASNYYLIPVKPDPISFTGIDLLRNVINSKKENYDLKIKCIGVVLTMVESGTLVYQQAVDFLTKSSIWNKYLYNHGVPKRTEIARNQMNKSFILDLSGSDAKSALTGLTNELISRLNKNNEGH